MYNGAKDVWGGGGGGGGGRGEEGSTKYGRNTQQTCIYMVPLQFNKLADVVRFFCRITFAYNPHTNEYNMSFPPVKMQ